MKEMRTEWLKHTRDDCRGAVVRERIPCKESDPDDHVPPGHNTRQVDASGVESGEQVLEAR